FATWQALGFDLNGLNGQDPEFISITNGSENLRPDTGSPLIGAGVHLGSPYNIDITGSTHNNPPEVGAYKFGNNQTNNVNLLGKTLLEGPFNNNLMNTVI